jgi:predicted RNase H-like nuclease
VSASLLRSTNTRIIGLDLAWGSRQPDGIALLQVSQTACAWIDGGRIGPGDDPLIEWLKRRLPDSCSAFIAIDAPIICPNRTGARPVDRITQREFGRFHAGCHPANLTLCQRPPRVLARLAELGFNAGWDLETNRQASEVYPHPAMIRWFGLDQIIKYKRPPVARRRQEFARYQQLLGHFLSRRFPDLATADPVQELLQATWTKDAEDRLDALFCALIGAHHWRHRGTCTEVLGDLASGFLLVPGSIPPAEQQPPVPRLNSLPQADPYRQRSGPGRTGTASDAATT